MLELSSEQRRALRARAHGLNPIVSISQNGLTEAVLREISLSLDHHELIKIRVFHDERDVRETYLQSICEELGAAPVQHIGKLLVVWRPVPEDQKAKTAAPLKKARKTVRQTKRSHQND